MPDIRASTTSENLAMQCNTFDAISRLIARARRLIAAWGASEDFGMCLLAIGLMLLPAFVSADDGGRFSYQAAAAFAVPSSGECSADKRHPPEPRRSVQAPLRRADTGMRKLASILCNGRARVAQTMPLMLAPVLARFDIDPEALSAFLVLLAMLVGLLVTAAYTFVAAAGLFGLARRGRAGGVPRRENA